MKKTIMLDLDDGVTNGSWKQEIENFLKEKIDLEKVGYYLEEALKNRKQEFYDSLDDINMYKNCGLKENAYETIKQLNEKYDLYLVSSYALKDIPSRAGEHLKNKYEFIYQHLPFISQSHIFFMNEKTKIHYDIGIDDKLMNLQSCNLKLLFRAWHNEEDCKNKNVTVVNNWLEIAKLLLEEGE